MAGAALFLPFLPMLPIQILLNNLLYDVSEIAIPFDRVDPEAIARPVKWDIKLIERFMLVFGPVSSVFDFLTFYALLHLFGAGEALFQTGWFIESMTTQVLVVFAIRTRRRFFRSRPHGFLVAMALGAVAVAIVLPLLPVGRWFGFVRAAAAVLRLPGGRDGRVSGARRNHQGLFLPMCWQAMIRCCGRMEGEISVSVGHGQRRGTAGLMSYGAMCPPPPVAKCHRAICTTMARGTRLDTEIVTGDISRRLADSPDAWLCSVFKRSRSRSGPTCLKSAITRRGVCAMVNREGRNVRFAARDDVAHGHWLVCMDGWEIAMAD